MEQNINTRKKILWAGLLGLLAIGFVYVSIPFATYFGPADNSGETLPSINVAEMKVNTFINYDVSFSDGYSTRYLIIKKSYNVYIVYHVYVSDDHVVMPDRAWFRWGGICKDFGPEVIDGEIKANGLIMCHDQDIEEGRKEQWRWTLEGKKLSQWTADMDLVKHSLDGTHLILGKG